MIATLPGWVGRALALGLLALVLALISVTTIVPAWRLNQEYDQRIDEVQRQLRRFTDAATQEDGLRAVRDRLQAPGATGRYYLRGSTPALAAAELQRLVKRIVTGNQGQLTSTQVVPTDDSDDIQRVVIRVKIRGDINMVQKTFHSLETGTPYLFLENVRVRSLGGRGPARRWAGRLKNRPTPGVLQLDAQFDLMGYLLSSEQAEGGK